MSVEVDDGLGTTLVNIGTLMLQKPRARLGRRHAAHRRARARACAGTDGEADRAPRGARRRTTARSCARSCPTTSSIPSRAGGSSRRSIAAAADGVGSALGRGHRRVRGARPAPRARPTASGRSAAPARRVGQVVARRPRRPCPVPDGARRAARAAFVDQVTARLAVYLGPIAQIVTKRAAREAKSRSDFVQRVADNLGTQDRAAFLHEMGYGDR